MAFDAFVLAGGASRRFGEDKALAVVDGRRLVDRVAAALAGHPVWVVRRRGQAQVPGHPVLEGPEGEDRHPLWGVAVALEASRTSRALLVPCDLVTLSQQHVRDFLATAGEGEAVAHDGERLHPLFALLSVGRAAAVRRAAAEGQSVRRFLAELPAVAVPPAAVFNLNRRPLQDSAEARS